MNNQSYPVSRTYNLSLNNWEISLLVNAIGSADYRNHGYDALTVRMYENMEDLFVKILKLDEESQNESTDESN